MMPTRQGAFRLFRVFGIDVYLHWLWFVLAYYSISWRVAKYQSPAWAVLEYLSLFLIVLLHEFGHSLACRSVGGQADEIILWPLGGVAYVNPPPRAGATLWSIVAGPLVNVVLLPVTFGLYYVSRSQGWAFSHPDLHVFIRAVTLINFVLLSYNLLPLYPLDGGQILRALLWFPLGMARSLLVATVIGMIGGAALLLWVLVRMDVTQSLWLIVITIFLLMNCWRSFVYARALRQAEKAMPPPV